VPDNPSIKVIQIDASHLGRKIPTEGGVKHIALTAHLDGQSIPLTLILTLQHR
jgi:hypothetical protein